MRRLNLDLEPIFICSFNIPSLFANFPLKEIIQICAHISYCTTISLFYLLFPRHFSLRFQPQHLLQLNLVSTPQFKTDWWCLPCTLHLARLLPYICWILRGGNDRRMSKPVLYFCYANETFAIFNDGYRYYSFLRHIITSLLGLYY